MENYSKNYIMKNNKKNDYIMEQLILKAYNTLAKEYIDRGVVELSYVIKDLESRAPELKVDKYFQTFFEGVFLGINPRGPTPNT